jgi:hypothetical protein
MPTLAWTEYLTRAANSSASGLVVSRGYDPATWREIDQLLDSISSPSNKLRLPLRVLQAGECPNDSRVFHSLTDAGPSDPGARSKFPIFLGQPYHGTRLKAGSDWDTLIERANRAANRRLKVGLGVLGPRAVLPPPIRDFYNSRMQRLWILASSHGIESRSLQMKIKPRIGKSSGLEIEYGKPDGLWIFAGDLFECGGIFEAKLSLPPPSSVARILATYALLAERRFGRDFDFGSVLVHSAANFVPELHIIPFGEAIRQDCLLNVRRAAGLVAKSILSGKLPRQGSEWARTLARPAAPERIPACSECRFESRCNPLTTHA